MNRPEIYDIITKERVYQDSKWGGKKHDEGHNLEEWYNIMRYYVDQADYWDMRMRRDESLEKLRKALAVGVAAAEVFGLPERV